MLDHADHLRRQGQLGSARTALEEARTLEPATLKILPMEFEFLMQDAELCFEEGAAAKAEKAFRDAAARMEALLVRHEDFIMGRLHMAEVHQRLGDLCSLSDRKAQGLLEYQAALDWARAACRLDPGRSWHQDKLGLLLNRVAQMHLNDRRVAQATPLLDESRRLYLRLAETNPRHLDWVSRLA